MCEKGNCRLKPFLIILINGTWKAICKKCAIDNNGELIKRFPWEIRGLDD